MKNEISDTWSDQQKLEKQISGRYETYEILIKKITFSNFEQDFLISSKEKEQMNMDQLNFS